jgi:N-acetyl-anhydromuramyl-L-alanine amidase AmpD
MHKSAWLAALLLAACALPAAATPNGPKRSRVDTIIVHAISGPSCSGGKLTFSGAPGDAQRWKRFFDNHPFLGIHYVLDRDGVALASTPEDRVANHALGNNETTIGIELVHDGDSKEPFSDRQIEGLITLIKAIRSRHDVPLANIKGHSDVDRRTFQCGGSVYKTKMDPGDNFPWDRLRAALAAPPRLIALPTPAQRPLR